MSFIRRLVGFCAVVLMASAVSGCVIRPLWWGDHEHRNYKRHGYQGDQQRSDSRQEDWRQAR